VQEALAQAVLAEPRAERDIRIVSGLPGNKERRSVAKQTGQVFFPSSLAVR
jgi:hypothetical protein